MATDLQTPKNPWFQECVRRNFMYVVHLHSRAIFLHARIEHTCACDRAEICHRGCLPESIRVSSGCLLAYTSKSRLLPQFPDCTPALQSRPLIYPRSNVPLTRRLSGTQLNPWTKAGRSTCGSEACFVCPSVCVSVFHSNGDMKQGTSSLPRHTWALFECVGVIISPSKRRSVKLDFCC
jgi:hypothetical protein